MRGARDRPTTGEPSENRDPELSVVVIARNEGERVEACLESVLDATDGLDREVLLVDSNSRDDTVERATDYPVRVLRIPDDDLCTPAAGRYVGTAHANGERILFVDGDMVLSPEWLARAREELDGDPSLAGVDGWLNEPEADASREVQSPIGVALYDGAALSAVGGFDPYLEAFEEMDLGLRLRAAGYRFLRLPLAAARHSEGDGMGELRRRWRRGFFRGWGQLLRKGLSVPAIRPGFFAACWFYAASTLWLVLGVLAAMTGRKGTRRWVGATGLGMGAYILARGPVQAASLPIRLAAVLGGVIHGFPGEHPPPTSFPLDRVEEVVRPERRPASAD